MEPQSSVISDSLFFFFKLYTKCWEYIVAYFGVVGTYPDGRSWDLLKGEPGERPKADENIAAIPFPSTAPLDVESGLHEYWK